MESQQLLPKSQVIQEKLFSGAKAGADPAEQMPKVYKHQGIIAKRAAQTRASKSLILQTCNVLAKHRLAEQGGSLGRPVRFCRASPRRPKE